MTRRTQFLLALAAVVVVGGIIAVVVRSIGDAEGGAGTAASDGSDVGGAGTGGGPGDGSPRPADQDGFLLPLLEEDGSVATIVAEEVVVLDEQTEGLLGAASEAGSFVSLELASDVAVEVGEVLVSGPVDDIAPSGFILRAVGVEETSDGSVRVAVEPAGLDDVFVQADISVTSGAWLFTDDENVLPALGEDRSLPFTPVSLLTTPSTGSAVPVVGLERCLPDVQERVGTVPLGPVSADIRLGLRPCFSVRVDLDIGIRERAEGGGRVNSLDVTVAVDSDVRLSALVSQAGISSGSDSGAGRFNVEWRTSRPVLSGRTPTRVAFVGYVPIVFDVGFAVSPRAEVSGGGFEMGATLAAGLEQRVRYRTGEGWTIDGERPRADIDVAQFFAVGPQSDAVGSNLAVSSGIAVEARAEVEADVQFRLYGFGGPTIRAAPGFSGVLPLGPDVCPRASWVADIPFSLRFAPDVSDQGWLSQKLDWIDTGAYELERFELGRRTWPEDCTADRESPVPPATEPATPDRGSPDRHRTAWSGTGGGRGELSYDISSIAIDERGAPDGPSDVELAFTLSGELGLDLSAVSESIPLVGDFLRFRICDPNSPDAAQSTDGYSTELLLVDPVTRVIIRPGSIFSGDERSIDAPYLRITDTRYDAQGICLGMQAVLDERMMRIPISTDLARRIRENGVVVVLAPRQEFFPLLTGFDLLSASPDLWERSDWSTNVEGLPVLRPSD